MAVAVAGSDLPAALAKIANPEGKAAVAGAVLYESPAAGLEVVQVDYRRVSGVPIQARQFFLLDLAANTWTPISTGSEKWALSSIAR